MRHRCVKRITIAHLLAMALLRADAQNLLPNGDFEQYTLCPDYVSQIDRCVGWSRPTHGTSDYYNACLGVPFSMNVPNNQMGDEPARSGNGYVGFYAFSDFDPVGQAPDAYREYITHALSTPLVPGTAYQVEFFVSLADVSKFAVNELGALFSMAPPVRNDDLHIPRVPQVVHGGASWLDDKMGWTRIAGCFIADSAYTTLTIGNFLGTATDHLNVGTQYPLTNYCYYYAEDVSVMPLPTPSLGPDIKACGPVVISVIDPDPGTVYTWNTGSTGSSITVDTTGIFIVTTSGPNCPMSDTVEVTIGQPFAFTLPIDTLVDLCTNPLVVLDIGPIPYGASAYWSTGSAGPRCEVSASGTYSVTVDGPEICPSTAEVRVIDTCVGPVFIPNAVSPNGDGINDRWKPVWWAERITSYELRVFDRWGHELFFSMDPDTAWEANDVPVGVYAYQLHAIEEGSAAAYEAVGHVTVVR
ncbi:MAG: gliding motility-associated C-terminal domain-containing protein [Flavobacteriales bacterium]|nr:gliding motility-associated C-terminal domain-containing protein [Flavobacteriales bacterium]